MVFEEYNESRYQISQNPLLVNNMATTGMASSDREKDVMEFDATKAGVKGLVDSGVVKIPKIFIHPPEDLPSSVPATPGGQPRVPVIDLEGLESDRARIVDEIRKASETWGFFQILNHGIPISMMNQMLEGVRQFHEQTREVKKEMYTRDAKTKVRYYSNGVLDASKPVCWRDSLTCDFFDDMLDPQVLPLVCRKAMVEYMKFMFVLRDTLSELLSEALGLRSDYISSMEFTKSGSLGCHYYPGCPQPDLTIGAAKHSDLSFLTILLQDNIGGLQILHQNHWLDVSPLQGALVINIGDMMQIISNGRFKSVEHRAVAKQVGPRVSAACFLYPSTRTMSRQFGPLKELLSDTNQPLYRETSVGEYAQLYLSKGAHGASALAHLQL